MTMFVAAPMLLGLAGCANSTATGPTTAHTTVDSYIAPGGQPPAAPPPIPSPPSPVPDPVPADPGTSSAAVVPGAPPAPPAPIDAPPPPPGRPMTPGERAYRQACTSRTVQNGCELYDNDNALRLQGIDPGDS
jgi:hypothetical protein